MTRYIDRAIARQASHRLLIDGTPNHYAPTPVHERRHYAQRLSPDLLAADSFQVSPAPAALRCLMARPHQARCSCGGGSSSETSSTGIVHVALWVPAAPVRPVTHPQEGFGSRALTTGLERPERRKRRSKLVPDRSVRLARCAWPFSPAQLDEDDHAPRRHHKKPWPTVNARTTESTISTIKNGTRALPRTMPLSVRPSLLCWRIFGRNPRQTGDGGGCRRRTSTQGRDGLRDRSERWLVRRLRPPAPERRRQAHHNVRCCCQDPAVLMKL